MGRSTRRAALACLVAVGLGAGCSTPTWIPTGGGFRHARLGHWIASPDGAAADAVAAPAATGSARWERVELAGAGIAFRRAGATLSFQRRCALAPASPAILARHLVIGLEPREFVQAGPVALADRPGWSQAYRIRPEGGAPPLHFESVTLLDAGCALDWLLVAREGDREAIAAFDRWWRSFEFAPGAGDAEGAP
jgi:hypothetical protein